MHVIDVSDIGAFLGLDVGKGEHHATAVTPVGKKAFDKRLPKVCGGRSVSSSSGSRSRTPCDGLLALVARHQENLGRLQTGLLHVAAWRHATSSRNIRARWRSLTATRAAMAAIDWSAAGSRTTESRTRRRPYVAGAPPRTRR